MKIKSVKLHPFAGIQNQTFEFNDGLNVLCGPNEAGKTTLYNAIWNGLLQTTSLTARQVTDIMGNYFPVIGGDTIRVDIELLNEDGKSIKIFKTWKKGNRAGESKIILADGTEITDEHEVQKKIEELLPVSPATLKTVFLARQSGLHTTFTDMEEETQTREELGNVLRRNLMETGGVSVERFRELLDARYDEYFKNWDSDQQYPNNNRGIQHPYTKAHRGSVLDAFYEMEGLKLELDNANTFEEEMDRLNASLDQLNRKLNEKTSEHKKLKPLKEGIQKRSLLEQKLETANTKRGKFLNITKKWPVLVYQIEQADPEIEKKKEKLEELKKELQKSQNAATARELKQRIEKLEDLSKKIEDAKEKLNSTLKVEQADIHALRELESDIREFKAQIAAAKLTVHISSESARKLRYSEAGKDEREISIESGDTIDETAEGGFTLILDGLKVQVFSGEGDLKNTVQQLAEKDTELKTKLAKMKVTSVSSAEEKAEEYRNADNQLDTAVKYYESELGDDTIDELSQQMGSFGDISEVRSQNEISDDIVNVRTELNELESKIKDAKNQVAEWIKEYENNDNVILKLSEISGEIQNIERELKGLPHLPEGFDFPDDFVNHVDTLDTNIRDLEREISEKKIEITQKQSEALELSSEELESAYIDAQEYFERINREAETFLRVYEKATVVINQLDQNTYKGLDEGFMKWLKKMILDRFSSIELDRDIPIQFKTNHDKLLPLELLSHGTKDAVAVAWRIALSEHFLDEKRGFIVLDDPLVDLDPDRQKRAAEVVQEFSENTQVVVLTCHPVHAEMLGGKKIDMAV
jgi:DNA repair protein SbcC/Rad50